MRVPRFFALLLAGFLNIGMARSATNEQALAREILADPDLTAVLEKARALLKTGLTAGSGYGEVWIRDLNTFIEVSLEVNPREEIRGALLNFFKFQLANGDVPDGYIPKERSSVAYKYRRAELAPDLLAHKNTVETDQESSLVQAVRRYVAATGDRAFLAEPVAGKTVLERLELALEYVLTERFDMERGLVWGATTADWGDVQPEHEWGVELDASSHRAFDIYDNALFVAAIGDFLELLPPSSPKAARWIEVRNGLRQSIRQHLWDARREKFIPHLYLAGSPFPKEFDEAAIYYHGGTAVAIEAGLLSRDEISASLDKMRANVRAAGASSIGLTLYPVYPKGFFKNASMGPYSYQNGGDWCWFGGRMIQQLVHNGFVRDAYAELKPMVRRVLKHGDFHEWWSLDNQPRGSKQYRGSAGVLGKAIVMLQAWAKENAALGRTYRNPIIGLIGPADPHVILHEGTYYMYPTLDGRGYDVFVSKDLVHWERKPKCYTDARGGAWAPDVFHHRRGDGKFYLYYTVDRPGGGKQIGVAVAEHPLGPFADRGNLVDSAIDAHMFQDEDGSLYLYYVILPGFKITVQPMADPLAKTGSATEVLRPTVDWERKRGAVTEGPFMLKRNGVYYLMYSGSGADGPDYAIGYATASSPTGPFVKHPGNPIGQRGHGVFGPGHHSVIKGPDGKLWMAYHQQDSEKTGWNRFLAIDPLWFDEKGVIHVRTTRATDQPAP